ncbi:conserved oligomeric Golgi complex subunit 2-like [Daphnia pulex]|uniref:conserved oligomeric Golgi complex subunit 2-like n=1 Tax=Daphnia pulex TaxID=6669 RepID=UPI001EE0A236|nr:conserved oligomeric Golgi complex subunit 2-like [Daphnia pulex]
MNSVVPVPPPQVCFKREIFIQDSFSADVFLQDLWNSVPLEVLRDDLGSYLKVLRSAMIELINRDYADFVNLSGNLVGLDIAIANLQQPLISMHSDILAVEKVLHNAHSTLLISLSERHCLREQKLLLESLMKIPTSLDNLEKLLNLTMSETINSMLEEDPSKGNVIGRAANEYNQLQHLLVKCSSTPLMVSDLHKRTVKVNTSLMKCLERTLLYGIENHKRDILQKTLHTFVTLDQCKLAVQLVRINLVHPAFEKILNHNSLKKDPQDLQGLLNKIKDFIRQKLKDIIEISRSFEGLRGFAFVIDCLWLEFYDFLVSDLDCIFAQGNPDLFHKRYKCTMEFIDYLETSSNSFSSGFLKNDPKFHSLVSRWNLPVYFQMRFQELAGALETSLVTPFREFEVDKSRCNYKTTEILLSGLVSCYDPHIYLSPLAHRFWKLSLQMIGRYKKKISEILFEQLKINEGSVPSTTLTQSGSSTRITDMDISVVQPTKLTLRQLVLLDADIHLIITEFPIIWDTAWKQLALFGAQNQSAFESAFQASVTDFENVLLPKISQLIVSDVERQCASHLKHVADIPRLYRRTNKDAPTKAFSYVSHLLAAIREFRAQHMDRTESLTQWTHGVIKALSLQYLAAVSDVLTSVQKTEESLKRLRKDRNTSTSMSVGISDDDKIRIQLVIDVDSFVEEARSLSSEALPELQVLLDAVEHARQVCHRQLPTHQ